MSKPSSPLDNVRIASPCTAVWESMVGTEAIRFCGECRRNVYNLSAMTRPQAEALIAGAEGRLCVRYHRRVDGTIMTQDCPVGVRTMRRRLLLRVEAAFAAAAAFFLVGANANLDHGQQRKDPARMGGMKRTTMMVPPITLSDTSSRVSSPGIDRDTLSQELLPLLELHPPATLPEREEAVMGGVDGGPVPCPLPVLPDTAIVPQADSSMLVRASDSTDSTSIETSIPSAPIDSSSEKPSLLQSNDLPTLE